MLECMAGQRGVIDLDIDLEILVQPVRPQESDHGLRVGVVLVLHRLHRFGFDQEVALEPLRAGVVAGHAQHGGHVLLFALHVGVEQRHVAFAAAPEDVVLAAQFDRGVDGVLDLQHGAGRGVEVGVGRCAVHVAGVAEDIGRAPQQFDAGFGLFLLGVGYDLPEVLFVLFGRRGFVHEVYVVETIVLDADLPHEFETRVHLGFRALDRTCGLVPREGFGAAAELVAAFGAEGVPPRHRETEPILHLAAFHDFFGVIVTESHRVLRLRAFEFDLSHGGEILF